VAIKWQGLLSRARALGARAIATGHYARIEEDSDRNRFLLLRGVDEMKDQSYALWGLSQADLSSTILPLGGLTKTETRRLARQRHLPVADKKDSQEICFISRNDYGSFIERQVVQLSLGQTSDRVTYPWSLGPIVDRSGNILGQHRGLPFYTVGQRRGLGLALGRPMYVVDIDQLHNRLVVGPERELLARHLWASGLNWISIRPPQEPLSCDVQIRYRHRAAPARLIPLPDGEVHVQLSRPQRAITPGQSAVFYRGDRVLGGGIIRRPKGDEIAGLPSNHSVVDGREPST
jgi:tRNA-specific 2-thiouridylase